MTAHSPRRSRTSVGVVGVGNVTTTFHLPILSSLPDVDISYVADIDGKQARTFANIYGGDPIELSTSSPSSLPDIDVVLLATPVGVRDVYVDLISEMGAALFAEKPFAVDTNTHWEFLDQLSAPATCNYMRTTYSTVQQLTALVDSGVFGHVESVSMSRGLIGSTGISPGSFRTDSEKSGGGVLMEKGCHDLSQLVEIFRDADIEVIESQITWQGTLDVGVSATLHVGEPHDVDIDFRLSMVEPYETLATVEFADATVRFEHPEAAASLSLSVGEPERGVDGEFSIEHAAGASQTTEEAMYLRWRSFLDDLDANSHDAERATELTVTRLVTDLYKKANPPAEVRA